MICRAGCPTKEIMAKLGLKWADLFGRSGGNGMSGGARAVQGDHRNYQLWASVYANYTASLGLSDEHRAALLSRGLTEDQIRIHGYRTLGPCGFLIGADKNNVPLHQVPGFIRDTDGQWSTVVPAGIVIPVYNMTGHIRALQVRQDDRPSYGKYAWFSGGPGGKCGAPCHVPIEAVPAMLRGDPVRITEGAIKANIAVAKLGTPTIGLAGSGLWKAALPIFDRLRLKRAVLAFDMDWTVNKGVRAARRDLALALGKLNVEVTAERWDYDEHTDKYKGIDDALTAGVPLRPDTVDHGGER
jgi:hypothetical protein